MAYIRYAMYCKLTLIDIKFKFQRTGHFPLKQIHYCVVLSLICKYTLSLIRAFQRTSQTHMNIHTSSIGYHMRGEVISVLSLEGRYHILSRVSAANEGQNMIS